jgi:uncharacterized hydrophobic protein (TIGR00271 family)
VLDGSPSVVNVIHLPNAARSPKGDVILCDVAREDTSVVLGDLRRLGLEHGGSIALEEVDIELSDAAAEATKLAVGSPADAVVWEQVEERTSESAEVSANFLAFMVVATLIAAAGILTDSQVLIIGAMVVGPEFGPLAGFCVAVVERRLELARSSLLALAVGFPLAILATAVMTALLRWAGPAPETVEATSRPATYFISHPNTFTVIVALLAGVAGMLSLTTAKSGALVGVLISVTTIPAAANVGVAAAYNRLGGVPRRARAAQPEPRVDRLRGDRDAGAPARRVRAPRSSGGAAGTMRSRWRDSDCVPSCCYSRSL